MIIALQTFIFFRESVLTVLHRWLPPLCPLFRQLFLTLSRNGVVIEDDETEEQVFAEYDDERGVVFFPPVYAQRYAAVCDCLMDERWCGKLEKVVNMGKHHDMNFIRYLTEVPGITQILGVNIECSINCSSDLLDITFDNYKRKREKPLVVTLFQGNAADPDYRLIGCDAVVAIEMIEYMLPHDLDRLVHNVFGFIKPWIAIFTTPNADFNVLFKSLEKNGLRRLDHYFEWTRAQLHDWCSNIVVRYPGYTVGCRGVGPGPSGTSHCGCCSQLVLFMAKDYQKQMELDVNSLALVANLPKPNQISDFVSGWESPLTEPGHNNMLCGPTEVESFTDFQYTRSCSCNSTLTHSFSETVVTFQDKAVQCNLDTELGKSFLMFNAEDMYDVVFPRRWPWNRVYEFEDVANRLNNTMFVVNKFSKTTQNLMAKNKMDTLVHTREVMDEISHLAKMLNFNKNCLTDGKEGCIWRNYNWGENAPYWNQYYKVLAVYNYPYENKSEDSLILDLISDEINKFVDNQYDEDASGHVGKLEIPLERLMEAVKHITEDVDRVIDLMEYNGYEIEGDVVIHSRILVDDGSMTTRDDEWPDNDTYSDWDSADVKSTSLSDGSNVGTDFNARCLRRALDRKVRKLRTMFTHDEEITRELNQVVCRLMKIALSSSRGRQAPVQSKWLQCKLLDLLTLTEKAILRRKMRFIERYPLKELGYEAQDELSSERMELCRIKEDDTAIRIVEKYRHLVQMSDSNIMDNTDMKQFYDSIEYEDQLSNETDGYVKELDYIAVNGNENHFDIVDENDLQEPTIDENVESYYPESAILSPCTYTDDHGVYRTQKWINNDLAPYAEDRKGSMISSGDENSSKGKSKRFKSLKKHKAFKNRKMKNSDKESPKCAFDNVFDKKTLGKKAIRDFSHKLKNNKSKIAKKTVAKKSSYKTLSQKLSNKSTGCEFVKRSEITYEPNLVMKPNEMIKDQSILQLTAPKPIPGDIIELCHTGLSADKRFQSSDFSVEITGNERSGAATENSVLIEIITDETKEVIALRRTVGTDPDMDPEICEQELEFSNMTSLINDDTSYGKVTATTEDVHSQTIFLYDINEPTTSKGIRHLSMDVQCGTEATASNYAMLSATTSLTTVPQMFKSGIKIGDSFPDVRVDRTSDFGTSTIVPDRICGITSPRNRSNGIKIKDSDTQIKNSFGKGEMEKCHLETSTKVPNENCFVMFPTNVSNVVRNKDSDPPKSERDNSSPTTEWKSNCPDKSITQSTTTSEILKQVCSHLEDSCSEFNDSFSSVSKVQMPTVHSIPNESSSRVALRRFPNAKYIRPKLSLGGVHVHSYVNRQNSEDVVYLGEWQRYRSKPNRNKSSSIMVVRKNKEAAVKKVTHTAASKAENKTGKGLADRQAKAVPVQIRKIKVTKTKQEMTQQITQNKKPPNSTNITRPPLKSVKKVASKLAMSTKAKKSNSKTKILGIRKTQSVPPVSKTDNVIHQRKISSYIPAYLRKMPKRVNANQTQVKNKLNSDIFQSVLKVNKEIKVEPKSPQSNVKEIKTELLKVSTEPRENINFVVFRNEIENSQTSATLGGTTVTARPSDRGNPTKRALSPLSATSSTCSSPNSVATVRPAAWPKPLTSRKHSTPNNKGNVSNSSDSKILTRNRKFTKKMKTSKTGPDKDVCNKENVPGSSNNSNLTTKDTEKVISGGLNKSNEIFTAQFLSGNVGPLIKIENVKMSVSKSIDDKNNPGASNENKDYCDTEKSKTVLEPRKTESIASSKNPSSHESFKIIDSKVLSEWMASSNKDVLESHTNTILSAMKLLVEESLDFIETDSLLHIDSKTIVLSREGSDNTSLNDVSISMSNSFKTVVNNESETFKSAIGTMEVPTDDESRASLVRSVPSADADLLSFKSAPSGEKLSDCFADNESGYDFNSLSVNGPSVRDIFERKEMVLPQNPGPLAIQAFSGFSMNAGPVAGDHQPDYVNLIDSETGSGACDVARLATSEELFVSGRSSGSFGSCVIDEDSVVPNWLFEIISQQQRPSQPAEGAIEPPELPMQFAVDLDENSNEIGVAVGAGAGDGRGMHSDQSQDSSGRGTSLSSSVSSSEVPSAVVLIDPVTLNAPFVMLREPNTASTALELVPRDSSDASSGIELDSQSTAHGSSSYRVTRPTLALRKTSDVEADISSTDTDVPSDN